MVSGILIIIKALGGLKACFVGKVELKSKAGLLRDCFILIQIGDVKE